MNLLTIKQLDEWMTANCYNDNYAIGNRVTLEGCGLEQFGSLYIWYYTERGNRQMLKYFQSEQEAVAFAFDAITADKFAKSHLIGFLKDKKKIAELIEELNKRGVEFWKDEIPYDSMEFLTTRIFVLGCDIQKVLDLQARYTPI